ncbi:MAG: toll/interleukin-1 receptor domain-containing protein [Verrucomicrobiae bacterium]|nr:toll/interleukin-1 receptor domain-containing protein [Verrucomicrobiae bacterium]
MEGNEAKKHRRKQDGRIFINYRREDAGAVAGRLSDALENYFGEGRIFRDIEGIAGGAPFDTVIEETLGMADAVIVLIGDRWLTATNADGTRRIDDPEDWVAREIEAALERGTPIFPVLIEDAQMPAPADLPESIRPLARHNAVRVSDHRWSHDVIKLAQVIALDIPDSIAERKLTLLNRLISIALFLVVSFTLGLLTVNLIGKSLAEDNAPEKAPATFSGEWFSQVFSGENEGDRERDYLDFGLSSLTFVVILFCVVGLALYARLVDPVRRRYVYAAIVVGGGGCFFFFLLIRPTTGILEGIVNIFGSTVTAFAMLALINLSGLKAK